MRSRFKAHVPSSWNCFEQRSEGGFHIRGDVVGAAQPPDAHAARQDFGHVALEDGFAVGQASARGHSRVRRGEVGAGVVLIEVELVVQAQRFDGRHGRAVAADAAKAIAVGADDEVHVGRAQDLAQAQVPAALVGGVLAGVSPSPKKLAFQASSIR